MADNVTNYVQQYGDALQALVNQPPAAAPPQTVAPANQGAFAAAGPGPGAAPAAPGAAPSAAPTMPPGAGGAAPGAPAMSAQPGTKPALASAGLAPPADTDSDHPYNFHNLWKQTAPEDQQKIADEFEKQGVDIKQKFEQLQGMGVINAPTKDYSKKDMAGFLMEAGLRMAQAGGKGDYNMNPMAAAATGILGATESRRDKQLQGLQLEQQMQDRNEQRQLTLAQMGQAGRLGELQRETQLEVARENAAARQGAAATAAGGRTTAAQTAADARRYAADRASAGASSKNDTMTDSTGKVFWKNGPQAGKPVMVQDKTAPGGQRQIVAPLKPGQQPKPAISEKDIASQVQQRRKSMDGNILATVSVGGQQVPWRKATDAQKSQWEDQQAAAIRRRAGVQSGGGASSAANPYARFKPQGAAAEEPADTRDSTDADSEGENQQDAED